MYIGFHVTYPLLLSDFNQNYKTPTNFSKNPQYHVISYGHMERYEQNVMFGRFIKMC
jgi:hypothetical protein